MKHAGCLRYCKSKTKVVEPNRMLEENQGVENGEISFSNPVFVVGFYRSGTSLLYALLNRHSQMALMFECNVWDFPEVFSRLRFKRDWLRRQEFYNEALSRHRLIFGDSLRGLEHTRTPDDLYRTFGEMKNSARFGEKSPAYCVRLGKLAQRYPRGSFVLLWRDPVEIYRSVLRTARKEPFFQRRGVLSRLIFCQEQMIQQTAEFNRSGIRVCHVTYDELMEDAEKTCRKICQFLAIPFEDGMLNLTDADLSAIGPGSEHDHLRRGRIERQRFEEEKGEIITPSVLGRLQRFDARWRRLKSQWSGIPMDPLPGPEPSGAERLYCKITGLFFRTIDDGTRMLFEFLPLAWLRSYRQIKKWFLVQRPVAQVSLREQFSNHSITILTSYSILAAVAGLDYLSGPDLTLAPFYLIPPAFLSLTISRRWGTFAALIAATLWSSIQSVERVGHVEWGLVLWNSFMRFLVFQIVILLLDRVREENTLPGRSNI